MSGPNNINRSNQSHSVDPYSDEWLNDGGYAEEDGSNMVGEGYAESGYQDVEGHAPSARSMTGSEAAAQIKTLYDQIKKDPNLGFEEKNQKLKELKSLHSQANSYRSKPVPNSLLNEISRFELDSMAPSVHETESGEEMLGNTEEKESTSGPDANSPAGKIAELAGTDPETITEAAKAKGIDLNNLPKPPTRNFIEFLLEINPTLSEKFGIAEEKIKARSDDIQPKVDAAKARNSENVRCSSDNDNTDVSVYQKLYDLKYHQDDKSKEASNAMIEANTALCDFLNKIDPNYSATPPSQASGSGWEAFDNAYKNADKITVGGQSIDIFNNSTGKLNVGSADAEPTVEIVTIQYDWEGSGDWEDKGGVPSISAYGQEVLKSSYDNG